MHQAPTNTSWQVTCRSPEEAQVLRQWLAGRIDLDRVLTDTARISPGGLDEAQSVGHRLGDYFTSICVAPEAPPALASFRLVFQKRPDAERFWKDLMVNILQEIEANFHQTSLSLHLKGEAEVLTS